MEFNRVTYQSVGFIWHGWHCYSALVYSNVLLRAGNVLSKQEKLQVVTITAIGILFVLYQVSKVVTGFTREFIGTDKIIFRIISIFLVNHKNYFFVNILNSEYMNFPVRVKAIASIKIEPLSNSLLKWDLLFSLWFNTITPLLWAGLLPITQCSNGGRIKWGIFYMELLIKFAHYNFHYYLIHCMIMFPMWYR